MDRKSCADATKLPTEYVARRTAISGQARSVWEKARAEMDSHRRARSGYHESRAHGARRTGTADPGG